MTAEGQVRQVAMHAAYAHHATATSVQDRQYTALLLLAHGLIWRERYRPMVEITLWGG